MKLNLATVQAALEEFQEQLADAVEQPTAQEEIASDAVGEELGEQSALIDDDAASIGNHIEQVSAVAERIENAPGEMDAPLDPNIQAGAQIALESLNVALEADEGETKEGLLQKLWRYIKQAMQIVRNFGKRVVEFVKAAYAYCTDRAVRNKRRAEKIKKDLRDSTLKMKTRDVKGTKVSAEFEKHVSPRVREVLNNANGVSIGTAMENMIAFLGAQGRVMGKGERLSVAAALADIAEKPQDCDKFAKDVLDSLDAISSPGFEASSNAAHAKAVQAGQDVSVRVSKPFFAGYRAYVKMPKGVNVLSQWGAGVAVMDAVQTREKFEIPSVEKLMNYTSLVQELSDIIEDSKRHADEMERITSVLNKEIKDKGDAAIKSDSSTSHVRTVVSALQTVIPRAIKGPSVDVMRLATKFSSSVLDYIQACRSAYEENEDGAKEAKDFAQAAKNAGRFGLAG